MSSAWTALFLTVTEYKFLLQEHYFPSGPFCFCGFNHLNFRYILLFLYLRIIGLYVGLVLLFSKIIRGIMTGLLEQIMFTELPNVDRILQVTLLQNSCYTNMYSEILMMPC